MNVEVKPLENREVEIIVAVDDEQVQKAKQVTARKLSKQLRIPGFRPGKAPYNIVVRYVSEEGLLQESLEDLAQEAYQSALKQENIEPAVQGLLVDVKITELPIRFTYKVPLVPEVNLGDYREYAKLDYTPPVIDEARVNQELQALREEHGTVGTVERPAILGDQVVISYQAFLEDDDEAWESEENYELSVKDGADNEPAPGFALGLVGISAGESKTLELKYGEDFGNKSLAGQPVRFVVTCDSVRANNLPELNDEFASMVGESYTSLEQLRTELAEDLKANEEAHYDGHYTNDVLGKITAQSQIVYSPLLVEHEVEHLLEEQQQRLKQNGITMEKYMSILGKTEEEIKAGLQEQALEQVKNRYIIGEFARQEMLQVRAEQFSEYLNQRFANADDDRKAALAQAFASREMQDYIANEIFSTNLSKRLIEIGKGVAPSLEELAASQENEIEEVVAEEAATGEPASDAPAATE